MFILDIDFDIALFQECIDFCAKHKIIPITKIVKATDLGEVSHHLTEAPSSHHRAANSLKTPALKKVFRVLDLNVTKLLYTAPIVHRQPE